ncbi:MAG TPA: ABC transporter ATP-binding protein [Firmicutes bacterium]|nr:ABC transporter ATP-binding protein [Bacillota bacterium]
MEFTINHLKKAFGAVRVFDDFSLAVPSNEITAILGPSGCGKTTLLSLIAGVLSPDSGTLQGIQGKELSYLFQDARLIPWKTVAQNIAFVLQERLPSAQIDAHVAYYLDQMGLSELGSQYPHRISGGQRQRAAMARALAFPSRILLMDEPFKSLDLGLKLDLLASFVNSWEKEPRTVLLVTHDVKEAIMLADTIHVFTNKPAVIKASHRIAVPRHQRQDDLNLLVAEKQIIDELTGG